MSTTSTIASTLSAIAQLVIGLFIIFGGLPLEAMAWVWVITSAVGLTLILLAAIALVGLQDD